jgi:hypothetical protein
LIKLKNRRGVLNITPGEFFKIGDIRVTPKNSPINIFRGLEKQSQAETQADQSRQADEAPFGYSRYQVIPQGCVHGTSPIRVRFNTKA